MTPDLFAHLPDAIVHWRQTDPVMARLAQSRPPKAFAMPRGGGFSSLVVSLLHQQVSIAAGRSITRKLMRACEGRLTPEAIMKLTPARMRAAGVSRQKQAYIRDLARRTISGEVRFRSFPRATDVEVIEALTCVKGIGVWTAKMFLLFHLRRPDIVAPEDLGLCIAAAKAYGVPRARAARFLERQHEAWRPYGSLASLTLWAHKDG